MPEFIRRANLKGATHKEKCTLVSLSRATVLENTEEGDYVMKNRWWLVGEDDVLGEYIMFYLGWSPQCNHHLHIAEALCEELCPEATLRPFPTVFVPKAVHKAVQPS